MSFYCSAFETADGQTGVALRYVAPPFDSDGEEMEYEETTVMMAFGRDEEAALLQLRAVLNAAMGAVELDILKLRRRDVPVRLLDIEEGPNEEVIFAITGDGDEDDGEGD